jgi:hypothetical protein
MKSMNCDLAKQLRDAGFPFRKLERESEKFYRTIVGSKFYFGVDQYAVPTVSELIEACRPELQTLTRNGSAEWFASNDSIGAPLITCSGATLEVAVEELYLALNKKV